jgi:alpha-methylacyl-CoA racemase
MTARTGPLAGVRIIEMDAIGPAPLAGMILSGLGADIVRIARPGGQSAFADVGDSVLLRGRTHVTLDLKNTGDREKLLLLVEGADALIEGLRPGVMERLGLGPDACLARNPRLVYARATGWGQEGPLARSAGHDINYIALTGVLHAIGEAGRPPVVPLNILGDYAGGTMFLALGVVAGVLSARQTGKGQIVDAAIVDGVANLMGLFQAFMANGLWQDRRGANILDGSAPFYRCYACSDSEYVAVGALEPQFFAALLAGLEIPADRFAQYDAAQWPALAEAIAARFAAAPRAHWETVFAGTDACVAPVLSMRDAMAHPANVARGVFLELGGVAQATPAPRFSATPGGAWQSQSISIDDAISAWRKN